MRFRRYSSPRAVWRQVHLWIGLGIALLVVPIGLTGTALVVAEQLDRLFDPEIYALTGTDPVQPSAIYIENALAAVPGAAAVRLRYPGTERSPVTVLLRGGELGPSEAMRLAHLDPATGRVLGVRDFRGTLMGLVHMFHANLMLQDYNGRSIVGWTGVGLFVLASTGIYLWWPRNGGFRRGLRWRRSTLTSANIHHMSGFWICVPLALLASTGITMSFPQQSRWVVGLVTAMGPRVEQGGKLAMQRVQDIGRVAASAAAGLDGSRVTVVAFPTERGKAWRVQLARGDELRTVTVDDATGAASLLPEPLPGDAFMLLLRRLHEGDHHGSIWRAVVFTTGLGPALLLVTGFIMWRRRTKSAAAPRLGPTDEVAFQPGIGHHAATREKLRDPGSKLSQSEAVGR
jgi:uncharacterized iron-regulated membrane protein